jgi:Ca2+-binding EF-hand superfamily protein
MRTELIIAFASLALAGIPQQRGTVGSVTAAVAPPGEATVLTVVGTNPCSSLRVEYGDGTVETHNVQSMPANIRHTYARPGTYQVRVRGTGTCAGVAAMTVRVTTEAGAGGLPIRYRAMDRNGDGQITRAEWRGSLQSFRVHDWNGDGTLSGDEIRAGAQRTIGEDPDYSPTSRWPNDWSRQRFSRLDVDNNSRISREEWPFDYEAFVRADRNRDGALTETEFLGTPDFDDDRMDQFDYLDLNGNNRIERTEWHGSAQAFTWLDRNNNGVLDRSEVAGEDLTSREQFVALDFNGDGAIALNEWQWSRRSFDRLDSNRDGRLSRAEFDTTSPIGTSGTSAPIIVASTNRWTDTGIWVRAGDMITFNATGTIEMTGESGDPADPTGSRTGRRAPGAPLPNEPAGILLARIGSANPVAVGRSNQLRAAVDGRLYLGVNDDHLADNHGEFRVTVSITKGTNPPRRARSK